MKKTVLLSSLFSFFLFGFLPSAFSGLELRSESIVPKPFFAFWNAKGTQTQNNCYNYATNRVTNNFAQPGEASGSRYTEFSCEAVYKAAGQDLGLEPTEFFPFSGKKDDLLIALVVAPDFDFHWYRRGDDDLWTHKMGGTPATDRDNDGQIIKDPKTAKRGAYTDFCGYFRVKNFPKADHEQDGGRVRIGDMKQLPEESEEGSVVRMLAFSGRRDPEIPLRQIAHYLDRPAIHKISGLLRQHRAIGPRAEALPPSFQRLGYRGLQIIDREGEIFPAGTVATLRDGMLFLQSSFAFRGFQAARVSGLADVEKAIRAEIEKGSRHLPVKGSQFRRRR